MTPRIETSRSGQRILICFYTDDRYDEAIAEGERMCGVLGERLAVITYPDEKKIFDKLKLSHRGR